MRITFIGKKEGEKEHAKHIIIEGMSGIVSWPDDMDAEVRIIFESGEIAAPTPVEGGDGFYVAFGDLSEGEFVLITGDPAAAKTTA